MTDSNTTLIVDSLRDRLAEVQLERDHFAREVAQLRADAESRTASTTQVVATLQREQTRLQKEVARLSASKAAVTAAVEETTANLSSKSKALVEEYVAQLAELREEKKQLESELAAVEHFKRMREDMVAENERLREQLKQQAAASKHALDQVERDHLASQERLKEEAELKLVQSRAQTKAELVKELDAEAQRIREENLQLVEELGFHEQTANALEEQNHALRKEISALQTEISLAEEKDAEYAKRGVRQNKVIRDLTAKVKSLERSLNQALRDIEVERASWHDMHQQELQDAQREAASSRHALQMQMKDSNKLRKLANAVLKQRTEVEHFLMESLAQVKYEMRLEQLQQQQQQQQGAPPGPGEKVELADMTWGERERVLRILFARINRNNNARQTQGRTKREPVKLPQIVPRGLTFITDMDTENTHS